jgi:hypothetical protein
MKFGEGDLPEAITLSAKRLVTPSPLMRLNSGSSVQSSIRNPSARGFGGSTGRIFSVEIPPTGADLAGRLVTKRLIGLASYNDQQSISLSP